MLKNLITNKNEAKTMTKHISSDCKCNFNSATCNSNVNGIIKHVNVNVKKYLKYIKDCSWNTSTCICEKSKYLKSIADASVIACDEIISVMDIVSTNMTNTIATNMTKNCHSKKEKYKFDCYILHTVLLAIILLLNTIIMQNRKTLMY